MATLVSDPHDADGAPGGAARRDAALAEGLRAGRPDAFEQLYELYRRRIFNLVLRIVQSPEDACDITHDVFVKAFHKLPDSPMTGVHLTPWLYRVAVNTSYDHLRTRRVHRHIDEIGVEARPAPIDTFEQAEIARLVEESLAALSARHRTVLVLKDIHGLRHEEIAEILGVSRGATERLLHRARRAFRAAYLDLTRVRPHSRSAEKWSAAGVGLGMFVHEIPLPAALQGGFPFGAAGACSGAGAGVAGAVAAGAAAGGAGAAGGSSLGLTLAAGGVLAKVGGAASIKVAAAVIAVSCAAGGGVAAYETGAHPGLEHRAPEQTRTHTPSQAPSQKDAPHKGEARGRATAPGAPTSASARERATARHAPQHTTAVRGKTDETGAGADRAALARRVTRSADGAARPDRATTSAVKGAADEHPSGRAAASPGWSDKPDEPGRPGLADQDD